MARVPRDARIETREARSRLKVHHETQARTVGERPDGRTAAAITGRFQQRFRQALLMCAVRRAAACQQGVGPPQDVHPGPGAGLGRAPYHTLYNTCSPAPIMSYSPVFAPNF